MTEQDAKAIVAFPSLVAVPADVMERAYELWSTVGGRNAAATRRLLEQEAEDGDMVPTDRAIRKWAQQHGWAVRADRDVGQTKDQTLYELGVKWRALVLGSADVFLRAQTGGYAGREMEGALAVKASEIAMRQVEKGVIPLLVKPPEIEIETDDLSREEREALARQALVRREKLR
jgi:hypothetical protein